METPAKTATSDTITAVILAGGRGRRMGGADKGLLPLHGKPLVAHVIEALRPQVDHILINCNRHFDAYRQFGYPLLPDRLPEQPGPLAGLLAALESVETGLVLSAPCDTPQLPPDLAARLREGLAVSGRPIATVRDEEERLHPVILLAEKKVATALRRYLETGERRVEAWVRSQDPAVVDYADRAAFANANTPDELAGLETKSDAP